MFWAVTDVQRMYWVLGIKELIKKAGHREKEVDKAVIVSEEKDNKLTQMMSPLKEEELK